jgi:hypothetical protein
MKRRHTCIAYVAKSETGPKEKQIIHSDQDVQVCGKYVDARCMKTPLYMVSLPFEMFLRTWLSSSFFNIYLDFHVSNIFFMLGPSCVQDLFSLFFDSPSLFCNNGWRETNTYRGAFIL